ncbi:hypothetical protein AS032_35235 [Rhodococcus qingshengii]|nr:hypothetical protein AOT96_32785 [Rhodococcus sp. 008]KSU55834.1 hypothetical protein AS032_35235 [Rhodococcus qingshengii]
MIFSASVPTAGFEVGGGGFHACFAVAPGTTIQVVADVPDGSYVVLASGGREDLLLRSASTWTAH